MMYGLYAMRDVKTGFMTPAMDVNDQAAIRNFCHTIANADNILYTFAQDFSLYHIANYDSDSGIIDPCIPVIYLIDGAAALRSMKGLGDSDA